jgi:hypothetical protein
MWCSLRPLALVAATLSCLPFAGRALAQSADDPAKAMVGAWEISNADRDRRCTVTFSTDPAPGGLKLELDPGCAAVFPPLKDVVVWRILADSGPLRLLDARGTSVLEFSEVENGIYEAERPGEGLYFMQTQAAAAVPARTPEQMLGSWSFMQEADKPLCALTLSNAADGAEYKLSVKPGCNARIAALALSTWRLEGDQLVLSGSGGTWRFVESDVGIWERIPPSTDPMLLIRQ